MHNQLPRVCGPADKSALDGNHSSTSCVENRSAALPVAPSSGELADESDSADVTAEQSVAANDT